MNTKILSLDVSSVSSGYSIFENGQPITYGIIAMKQPLVGEKLEYFEQTLIRLIEAYSPTHICIEQIFSGPSPITFKTLAFFHSIVMKLCYRYLKTDPILFVPSQGRRLVGEKYSVKLHTNKAEKLITGKDSKRLVFDFIVAHFDLKDFTFKMNDITDALLLGLASNIYLEEMDKRARILAADTMLNKNIKLPKSKKRKGEPK